jgi:acyl-CoA thioesterase YciA
MEALESKMNFHTRKWVKPEDLNPNHSLFGGRLLQWIDEEAVIYAIVQLENHRVVTKFISEINFIKAPKQGDIIEIGIVATHFGRTSITMRCEVRNMLNREPILHIAKLVFVNLDESGQPAPHGKTAISYIKDRLQVKEMPLSAASNLPEEETRKNSS